MSDPAASDPAASDPAVPDPAASELDALGPQPDYAALVPSGFIDPPAVEVLAGARSHLGVPYAWPTGFRPLRVDVHLPADRPGPYPVVVYAHGGSWIGGIPGYGPWHPLPANGIAVVSVGYRLAGEARFPGPVQDVRAALAWVREGHYGLDPGRIAAWGSSAGAYLVLQAALPGQVRAIVDHYGPWDFARILDDAWEPTPAGQELTARVLRQFLGGADVPGTNPLELAHPGSPPVLIVHGDGDHRVGIAQSRRLRDGLRAAGVRAELVELPGADHAGPEFFDDTEVARVLAFLGDAWR